MVSSSPAPSLEEVLASAACTATLPRQPGIEILKEVTDITAARGFNATVTDAGDAFAYRITVANTGNTWLSNVTVTDPMFGGRNDDEHRCGSSYAGESSRFAPGGKFECSATLTLEQVHIDGRCVASTAQVRCATASSTLSSTWKIFQAHRNGRDRERDGLAGHTQPTAFPKGGMAGAGSTSGSWCRWLTGAQVYPRNCGGATSDFATKRQKHCTAESEHSPMI